MANLDKEVKIIMLKGEAGGTIESIEKTATSGLVDTYTITLNDGSTVDFQVTNGQDGSSIASITKTATSGLVDTYTVTLTNGDTTTFTVTNGQNGEVTNAQLNNALSPIQTNITLLLDKVYKAVMDGENNFNVGAIYNDGETVKLQQNYVDIDNDKEYSGTVSVNQNEIKIEYQTFDGGTITKTIRFRFNSNGSLTLEDVTNNKSATISIDSLNQKKYVHVIKLLGSYGIYTYNVTFTLLSSNNLEPNSIADLITLLKTIPEYQNAPIFQANGYYTGGQNLTSQMIWRIGLLVNSDSDLGIELYDMNENVLEPSYSNATVSEIYQYSV